MIQILGVGPLFCRSSVRNCSGGSSTSTVVIALVLVVVVVVVLVVVVVQLRRYRWIGRCSLLLFTTHVISRPTVFRDLLSVIN